MEPVLPPFWAAGSTQREKKKSRSASEYTDSEDVVANQMTNLEQLPGSCKDVFAHTPHFLSHPLNRIFSRSI